MSHVETTTSNFVPDFNMRKALSGLGAGYTDSFKTTGDQDPKVLKAMSELEAERAYNNDFGSGPKKGLTSKEVFGNFQDSLKLVCATLKNQDPTNPMDTKDLSQQFAIIAQTQGVVEIKEILQKMSDSSAMSTMLSASHQLDSLVKIKGREFGYSPLEQVELGFYAPKETARASYIIRDHEDRVVRVVNVEIDPTEDGYHGYVWDGKDESGALLKPGKYKFEVTLLDHKDEILRDEKDQPLRALTTIFGRVHGSDLKGGKARLGIAGHFYNMEGLVSSESLSIFKEKQGMAAKAAALPGKAIDALGENSNPEAGSLVETLKQEVALKEKAFKEETFTGWGDT